MRRKWFFMIPVLIALFILIGGEAVMHLWNWLLPTLFGWRQITFWQAIGILALCRILFGGLGGRGPGDSHLRVGGDVEHHRGRDDALRCDQRQRRQPGDHSIAVQDG